MANGVTINGFNQFNAKLNALPKNLKQEAEAVTKDAANFWEELAKKDAPVDQGRLRAGVSSKKTGEMKYEVVSASEYSAYLEWGTKSRVSVPAELQSYAQQFKGGVNQGGAKKMIFAWMERVGVPKEIQWIVFLSIIIKGIRPHPYFFHQEPIVKKQFLDDIKNILNTID